MSEFPIEDGNSFLSPIATNSMPLNSYTPYAEEKRDREDNSEAREPKKKKQKKAKRIDLQEEETLEWEKGVNTGIGNMDSNLLADYVAQRTKHFAADLSAVELEDRRIPGINGI